MSAGFPYFKKHLPDSRKVKLLALVEILILMTLILLSFLFFLVL